MSRDPTGSPSHSKAGATLVQAPRTIDVRSHRDDADLGARRGRFRLPAAVQIDADDKTGRERLFRYCTRPIFANSVGNGCAIDYPNLGHKARLF